jgi:hypothetical protein
VKPRELVKMFRPVCVSNDAPSELKIRGSEDSAASSARLAVSILTCVSSDSTSAEYSARSPSIDPSSPGSGSPACGSSLVISASSIAERTSRSMPSRDRSDV